MQVKPLTCGPLWRGSIGTSECPVLQFWGRGSKSGRHFMCILILSIMWPGVAHQEPSVTFASVSKLNDYIHIITDKDFGSSSFLYKMGYILWPKSSTPIYDDLKNALDWSNVESITITRSMSPGLTFTFGSCRKLLEFGGRTWRNTGKHGDRIFNAMDNHNPDLFLSIGDQVYFDPFGKIMRKKSKTSMRRLYRKVRNYQYMRQLIAHIPIYEMCDDHDLHMNNANERLRMEEPDIFTNGLRAFKEYQGFKGPETPSSLHYSFSVKNVHFFVMNTRSLRRELNDIPQIVGPEQLNAIRDFLHDVTTAAHVKFIVSPTPVVSQTTSDSWFGFPEEQWILLNMILLTPNVYILTGDAHCGRVANYQVSKMGAVLGCIYEIMSSGLVALNHDKGKPFLVRDGHTLMHTDEYDRHNDFPHTIAQPSTQVKLETMYASSCMRTNLFAHVKVSGALNESDMQIKLDYEPVVTVDFYDADNVLLHSEELQ